MFRIDLYSPLSPRDKQKFWANKEASHQDMTAIKWSALKVKYAFIYRTLFVNFSSKFI